MLNVKPLSIDIYVHLPGALLVVRFKDLWQEITSESKTPRVVEPIGDLEKADPKSIFFKLYK